MLSRVSWLSWLIFALSIIAAVVLAWNVDPHTPAGIARIIGSGIAAIVAVLTLVNGTRTASRIASIEAGRYPRLRPRASRRIAERVEREAPQTVTIDAEGGDDIRAIAAVVKEALESAKWHVRKLTLGGTLWDSGQGIMIYHTTAAAAATTALIEALRAEGLPVSDGGDCTTGMPVHIAFRRL